TSPAGPAGIVDHHPAASAERTWLRDRKHPLALGLDPATVAAGAGFGGGSRMGARAVAGRARVLLRNRNRHLRSVDGLPEGKANLHLEVASPLALRGSGPAPTSE